MWLGGKLGGGIIQVDKIALIKIQVDSIRARKRGTRGGRDSRGQRFEVEEDLRRKEEIRAGGEKIGRERALQ